MDLVVRVALRDCARLLGCAAVATVLVVCARPAYAQDPSWLHNATVEAGLGEAIGFFIYPVDLDNDDYPDLVTQYPSPTNRHQLRYYHNQPAADGSGHRIFVDRTAASRINDHPDWSPGVPARPERGSDPTPRYRQANSAAFADLDNDGDVDLVTCVYYHRVEITTDEVPDARCEVMLNDGAAHFSILANAGLHELGKVNVAGLSFLDYDRDGCIDLFLANWWVDFAHGTYRRPWLMRGRCDGTFEDVSAVSGAAGVAEPLYGSNVVDWDNDGWPDIFTSPYCNTPGSLYWNQGDGTFFNVALEKGYNLQTMAGDGGQALCQWAAMPADFDHDGDFDLFLLVVHGGNGASEGRSTIQVNLGPESGYQLEWQLDRVAWAFPQSNHRGDYSAMWFDLDNDGWQDLALAQDTYAEATDKLFVLRQNDQNHFDDITAALGLAGDNRIPSTHVATVLDYDLDGDDDVLTNLLRSGNQLVLLRNDVGNAQYHLAVKLVPPPGVNGSAIGARVTVVAGDLWQTREVFSGQGHFANQQPFVLNFGLGAHDRADSVEVRWPSLAGETWRVEDVAADQLLVIGPEPPVVAPPVTTPPPADKGCQCADAAASRAPGLVLVLALLGCCRRR